MATAAFPIHEPGIPYTTPPTSLQTLDVWLPRPLEESAEDAVWIVFVHGGAWRDPLQTSLNYAVPTLSHLSDLKSTSMSVLGNIAGVASISYRLSPYPTSTDGSHHPVYHQSQDSEETCIQHPIHVEDVQSGLSLLAKKYAFSKVAPRSDKEEGNQQTGTHGKAFKWIGIGHSCGATLLLQYISRIGLAKPGPLRDEVGGQQIPSPHLTPTPSALILTAGIYSLPSLLANHSPPHCTEDIAAIYRQIVSGAFGSDNADSVVYQTVSPVSSQYDEQTLQRNGMEGLELVVLAWSREDELVEEDQRDEMETVFHRDGWGGLGREKRVVERRDIKGAHDFVWEDGADLASLVGEVVRRV
ncbi:hypothetical protein B0J11DRAFT_524150 [Dendryphion nanum]|uniref:Uncharacterized protein n=1 Tax=Dendryphion nanum TaxID=256645 RepID=A0A9P9E6E6_9PLEO|nr:hypothetical protein B0J11DRAFT_524150 [Dendryphion nanum]